MQYVNAFWVGGLICVAGQILIDKTKLTPARILTGFVVAGVILGAIGLYKPLVDFAGARRKCADQRIWFSYERGRAKGALSGRRTRNSYRRSYKRRRRNLRRNSFRTYRRPVYKIGR